MKKVLFVATVDSHIRHFHIPYLKYFKEKGYEVHVATSDDEKEQFDYCDKKHAICMRRNPFNKKNLDAVKQMTKLIKDEKFDVVHCHTPMGSVVTRLAVRKLRKKDKKITKELGWSPVKDMEVLYTAHGFHFFKGAPLKYWLMYYNMEKWLSKYTDKLITINKEDYGYANDFYAKRAYIIDGIGVDGQRFDITLTDDEKDDLRKGLSNINDEFSLNKDDIVITYVAELIPRKNQELLIKAISNVVNNKDESFDYSKIKVLLVGTGSREKSYKKLIKSLNIGKNILLTGYRKDVPRIFRISDLGMSTSRQEGLGLNLIEALLSGVPVIASRVRGHDEIVQEGKNGIFFESLNQDDLEQKIKYIVKDKELREKMKENAVSSVKRFLLDNAVKEMATIYEDKI